MHLLLSFGLEKLFDSFLLVLDEVELHGLDFLVLQILWVDVLFFYVLSELLHPAKSLR